MGHPLVVHFKKQPYDVDITRPGPWGNPFSHKPSKYAIAIVGSRQQAIAAFEDWLLNSPDEKAVWMREHLDDLRGKVLGCWCAPQQCHGEVLARLANPPSPLTPGTIQPTLF